MYVIGTAGHVDHGKSALVKALTGIDPDRLQEEKERGMTIDLGFAWLKLPSGREVSIVDVPGHERFVNNMLAGVGGIDLALLVIAADEGVMPQTREHLAILDLLRVQRGVLVLTKKDLVDEEWLELVEADVQEVVKDTALGGAPVVATSVVTNEGLEELVETLEGLLDQTPAKKDIGRPRLPVDRVFTIAGFGTVVTGTLIDGRLTQGQEVEVVPRGLKARVRGLQTHRQQVEVALPGSRVAANLAGLSKEDLARGDVITAPGWLRPAASLDVRLKLLADAPGPLSHNAYVTFHSLASEQQAKVRLLEGDELRPGETSWAQLRFDRPVAVAKGDLFIIRTPQGTIGGGEVVDPHPRRHRRSHPETIRRLAAMGEGSPQEIVLQTLEKQEPWELEGLFAALSFSREEALAILKQLAEQKQVVVLGSDVLEPGAYLFTATGWKRLSERGQEILRSYHTQFPLRAGMPREEFRNRLRLPPKIAGNGVQRLIQDGWVAGEGTYVRLPGHQVRLSSEQAANVTAFLETLSRNPYSPPADSNLDPELINMLVEQKSLVRVKEDIIFTTQAYQDMVKQVEERIRSQGGITVAEVRDMFNTSRKYALALMEYLDQQRITVRTGDVRLLR